MSYNKIILLGSVGKDPEVREFDNGKMVNFSLATSERAYTNRNGVQVPEHTDWHTCIAFGKTADFVANYIRKGSKVFIEGKIRYRSYQTQNNETKWVTEVVVDRLDNLTPKSDNQQGYQQQPYQQQYQQTGYPQPPSPMAGYPAGEPAPTPNVIPGYEPPIGIGY